MSLKDKESYDLEMRKVNEKLDQKSKSIQDIEMEHSVKIQEHENRQLEYEAQIKESEERRKSFEAKVQDFEKKAATFEELLRKQ